MHIDAEKAIQELVARGIRLPAQPKILIELQKKLDSDNYSMKELAKILSADPGISAMLFKAVRSPVFSGGKDLRSIEQVLMVIGIKQTCNIVQAIALSSSLSDASRKSFEKFWIRSQEIAQIAALIAADRVSVCNVFPDQAYMAGIFHDCGVPVLMLRFPDYCNKLNLDTGWPNINEEDALFGVDHCSIGYLVARHWQLPDFICQAILHHHEIEIPKEELGAVRTLVAMLELAIHIYHVVNRVEHPHWRKIREEVLSELGIHTDLELSFQEEIAEQFLA
ncbi:MAG: HDOD domain-containing protein [Gallionella sp.]|jgi:HD-like signal output (HDOD) protein